LASLKTSSENLNIRGPIEAEAKVAAPGPV
jgi:hypothetical protein